MTVWFSVQINTTPTCNLKSKVINNIRSYYSRTHKKNPTVLRMSLRMRDFFFLSSVDAGCPKEASFIQLNGVISDSCEGALREEEWLLVSRDVLGFTGLCTASRLQIWSTCWRQLLVILEAISRAQRKASKSYWSSRSTPWGAQSLRGCYWRVFFFCLAESPLLNVNHKWLNP